MNQPMKSIPYGMSEFASIQKNNMFYVDKTKFIPVLESASRYVFFIRPRRFGKSLWLSTLQYYYDINDKDQFETIFKDTWICGRPTRERNSYLILSFNFAAVNPDVRYVEDSFEQYGKTIIHDFFERYRSFFTDEERRHTQSFSRTEHQLKNLFLQVARKKLKLYLFIDEYDNFANSILTASGKRAYETLTRGEGFFRFFFNNLKTATSNKGSGLDRMFVTGVSPITMDDVTSGMNIGDAVSLNPLFSEALGFSEQEVYEMLAYYLPDMFASQDSDMETKTRFLLSIMEKWYGQYRFSIENEIRVFNPDMVLYFIKEMRVVKKLPADMIDQNIKIDYNKLRYLMRVDRKLNGNFSRLKQILEDGSVSCKIETSFPLDHLTGQNNFVSLLYYFGLLTIESARGARHVLTIPNQTVKMLMYGYFREAMRDVDIFSMDLWKFADLMDGMVYEGKWRPLFEFISDAIKNQTSVRDYLEGERAVQVFMLAYLSMTEYYIASTEREMSKGYADIFLEPFLSKFPDMRFGYLIELKYIPRGEYTDKKRDETIEAASRQLEKYADDANLKKISRGYELKKLVLVYNGWELVYCSELG